MNIRTNIDPVRAEIMRLENALIFNQRAWVEVLIALTDRPCARADAARRMETAKSWQATIQYPVAVETLHPVSFEAVAI